MAEKARLFRIACIAIVADDPDAAKLAQLALREAADLDARYPPSAPPAPPSAVTMHDEAPPPVSSSMQSEHRVNEGAIIAGQPCFI